jgi:hypothetical protein
MAGGATCQQRGMNIALLIFSPAMTPITDLILLFFEQTGLFSIMRFMTSTTLSFCKRLMYGSVPARTKFLGMAAKT